MTLDKDKYNSLAKSGQVVISGKYVPGKIYPIKCKGESDIKAKCQSWFLEVGIKSHLILI